MPRKPSPTLTDAELRLMDVVWAKRMVTVAQVMEALPPELPLAYNTVLTTLRILEVKGYLRHGKAKSGRAFVYRPRVEREQASRRDVRQLLGRFFGNSARALVLNLLQEEDLGPDDWRHIQELLKRAAPQEKQR